MKKKTRIVTEKKVDDTLTPTNEQNTSAASSTDTAQSSSETTPIPPTNSDTKSDSVIKQETPKTDTKDAIATEKKQPSTVQDNAAKSNAVDKVATNSKSDSKAKTAAPTAKQSTQSPTKESSDSNKSGKLALVISLIALGAVGFQYYQTQQNANTNAAASTQIASLKKELSESIAAVSTKADSVKNAADATVSKAQATLAQVEGNLEKLKAAESQKSNDIDDLQQRLTKSIQQVENSSLKQNSRKDWLLAEVEYLLRLANQRVLMENTPVGALALLKSADQILQQTDDVSIFSVRKALAADMSALAAVPNIDQEGLYLKIDALSGQINNLKLVPLTDKKKLPSVIDDVATGVAQDSQESTFSKVWGKASAKLEKLVVISRRDSAIEPLLSPAQQAGLLQNLHILFEQTQLSLLQRKQAPYLRSIEKAEVIVKTYFQAKDGTTVALLNGLQELKEQNVSVNLPSIAGSLNTLKAYLKQSADIKSEALN